MRVRPFGPLESVSVLSLGGGGIGGVYGAADHDEAVATVRAAVTAGMTLLDLAPIYGPGEMSPDAELIVGSAFGRQLPQEVRVVSKVVIEDPSPPEEIRSRIRGSLRDSLARVGRDHLDLYILHSYIRPAETPPLAATVDITTVREVVRPELEALVSEGLITAWGLTATAATNEVCSLLAETPAPAAAQCVTNALDATGNLWPLGLEGTPDNARIRSTAVAHGVSVMGIRALAAGALADTLDRELPAHDPAVSDAARAHGFRALAHEHGVAPAVLAHRYALSLPGVATVVVGAKNRRELADCLAAEAAGPLSPAELTEIDAAVARGLVHA